MLSAVPTIEGGASSDGRGGHGAQERAFAHPTKNSKKTIEEATMTQHIRKFLLAGIATCATAPAFAADVTSERLINADKEPHNWLTNHRTYDSQRYSPLDKINKATVKSLKLAYAVAIGGTSANENLQATPLAEDGFLYVVDQWGVVYKIDVRSGDMGRIVWRMDPGQEKLPLSNRGAALWGNLVLSTANYPARVIATNKDTGKVVWETNLHDQPDVQITAAPRHRLQRAADDVRGQRQAICRDPVGLEPDLQAAARHDPGAARAAQPDHAVRVRAVMRCA
jgi:glucose dehydrogenase